MRTLGDVSRQRIAFERCRQSRSWGWAHPAMGGHDQAPPVARRPADPQNAGPDHRRTRRGRHGHRACAPPPGPGRPDAPNSGPGSAGGPEGSDLINGLRQGDFLAPARFQRQASHPIRTQKLRLRQHRLYRLFLQVRRAEGAGRLRQAVRNTGRRPTERRQRGSQ